MFRPMRRHTQQLSQPECEAILREATAGVLALTGDEGWPYAVPLSYVYQAGKLYFHCATVGHKLDAIRRDGRASFCVVAQDEIHPERYTTYFRSVIVFGRARVLEEAEEKRAVLELLAARYSPDLPEGRQKEIDGSFDRVCMVELTVEHLSGKEAIELARAKGQ